MTEEPEQEEEEEPQESFDQSSNEDIPSETIEENEAAPIVDERTLFLLGRTSRFRRAIKVNNKFFFSF